MRFAVESWAPEYGAPVEDSVLQPAEGKVDTDPERELSQWAPITPTSGPAGTVAFVDGVRRIDARLWVETPAGTRPGLCASYSAGVVCCDGQARVDQAQVRRALVCRAEGAESVTTKYGEYELHAVGDDAPEALVQAIQTQMRMLEGVVATSADGELIVVDGPLTYHRDLDGAVGYVKTHHVAYLPEPAAAVIERLEPGQRTPVVVTVEAWSRYLWYARLPGPGDHGWAGIVRCEVAANRPVEEITALADRVCATIVRFASVPHKDPRAPQNLYPIAALERTLRRRLGDPALVYRALRAAAAPGRALAI